MSDAAQTLQNPFTKESDRIKKLSEEIEKLKSKNKV
jgi:5-enolpyruvylshikimate-3-phosphate synthase